MAAASAAAHELPGGLARMLALLEPAPDAAAVAQRRLRDGYLDLLDEPGAVPAATGLGQRLMLTEPLARVYERHWRPLLGRVAQGPLGPGMSGEQRIARLLLGLEPGDGVLDIACGPGRFARDFARVVGADGLVVGLDVSPPMLAGAVRATPAARTPDGNVAYLRGDAAALPLRDAGFDAVCCFAALYFFADPWGALDEMARVLAPGGRLALMTSCRTRSAPLRALDRPLGRCAGVRLFDRDEVTRALAERGFVDVHQRIHGLAQYVGGVKAG